MPERHRDETGSVIVTLLPVMILLFVMLLGTNFVMYEYGQGVVRTAVDEAARAGSQQSAAGGPVAACQAKAAQVMGNLLNGPFGQGVTITCAVQGNTVIATATGQFPAWLPPVKAIPVHIEGASQLEQNPTRTS
jgi:hypothetical protein